MAELTNTESINLTANCRKALPKVKATIKALLLSKKPSSITAFSHLGNIYDMELSRIFGECE